MYTLQKAGLGSASKVNWWTKRNGKSWFPTSNECLIAKRKGGEEDEIKDTGDDTDTNKEHPVITKRLIIYTGVDIAKKRLKTAVDIIFTLTPSGSPPGGQWPTIVWKTLEFQPNNAIRHELCWYNKAGFCVLHEKKDATLKPGDLSATVEISIGAPTDIAVINKLPSSQRLALCTIDPKRPKFDQFLPVIDIGSMKSDDILLCGFPVMLQAYVVRGFKERKAIDTSRLLRPLFIDEAGKSKPLDIRTLRSPTAFRLYSNPAGKIILEND